ncbi:MAG: 6-bladed beta-propeller [Salinivirgaceae bacterium]|nr:6-bladed beta-propeller [Salinivirgaceae bacterium]
MRETIVGLLIVCAVYSCSNNVGGDEFGKDMNGSEIIDLSSAISTEEIIIDDIIDSIKIIQLDSNIMVGEIIQLIITDSNIYILDNYSNGSVVIFDNKGKLIKRISIGRGPGETNHVERIVYDEKDETLLVYQTYCISKYTKKGMYIRKYDMDILLTDFYPLEKGYLIAQIEGEFNTLDETTDKDHTLAITKLDSAFSICSEPNLCAKKVYSYSNSNHPFFISSTDDILIARPLDHYIYNYRNDSILVKYVLNLGKYSVDEREIATQKSYRKQRKNPYKYLFTGCFKATSNYQYIQVSNAENFVHIFRNIKNGSIRSGNTMTQRNSHITRWTNQILCTYNDFFVSTTSKEWLPTEESEFNKILNNPLTSPNDKVKIQNLKFEDNPLIVLYSLKDI